MSVEQQRSVSPPATRGAFHTGSFTLCAILLVVALALPGCESGSKPPAPLTTEDSLRVFAETMDNRKEADAFFRNDPASPFRVDSSAHYTGIKWYPPDVHFFFRSRLYRYEQPATVSIFGTKGEERKELRYGYFKLYFGGQWYRLNVYKFTPSDRAYNEHKNLLSVWFTDETTGKETYGVGRYLEIGDESPDPEHIYELNFNNAYNPYCAYSSRYSCAIPAKDDHLPFAVRAGELKYHE